jgi:hypothetical protein
LEGGQKFLVAFWASNGRGNNAEAGPAQLGSGKSEDFVNAGLANCWVSDYALFADVLPVGFELRFDQHDSPGMACQQGTSRRKNFGQRDE